MYSRSIHKVLESVVRIDKNNSSEYLDKVTKLVTIFLISYPARITDTLFVLSIIGVYVVSYIVNGLSVNFGGEKNELDAFKLTVYCFIPVMVLGAFSLIPALSGLYILGLYGIYLFYIGVPVLMNIPEDKALTFTVIVSEA